MNNSCPYQSSPSPFVPDLSQCWQNLGTGQVTCMNTQSSGQLPDYGHHDQYVDRYYLDAWGARRARVPGHIDSPLNRILTRRPAGPWEHVGYVSTDDEAMAQSRDRTMKLLAQRIDSARNIYNYQVIDSNGVNIDIGDEVQWKMDLESVSVPSQSATYTIHLYSRYK